MFTSSLRQDADKTFINAVHTKSCFPGGPKCRAVSRQGFSAQEAIKRALRADNEGTSGWQTDESRCSSRVIMQ